MGVTVNIEKHKKIYIDQYGNEVQAPNNHKGMVRQPKYHQAKKSDEEASNK